MIAGYGNDLDPCFQQPPYARFERRYRFESCIGALNHVSSKEDRIHFLFNREIGGELQRGRWGQLVRINTPGIDHVWHTRAPCAQVDISNRQNCASIIHIACPSVLTW